MSEMCLRAVRACGLDLGSRSSSDARGGSSRLALDDFELWRPRVVAWLFVAAALLIAYWVAWSTDRSIVASAHTPDYVSFEQAFPLADAWLAGVALLAAVALLRRRPSALIWLAAVGGAALYLGALDILYDLQHGIYAKGSSGLTELGINLITVFSGIGVIRFCWRFRYQLLGDAA